MDIVTRLKMFLDQMGISNSLFADTCDIPRPTLSQLLNGRNKKVSDEVIGKIHRAYPSLNVMWLMFGDGEMINSGSDQPQAADKMSDSSNGSAVLVDEMGQRAISFDDDESLGYRTASKPTQRMATPTTVNEAIQSIMRSSTAGRAQRGAASPDARRVINVMVFYNDGRFEEFGPAPIK